MSIKKLLAPVSGKPDDGATLNLALAVARRFGAHIEVMHARGDPRDAVPFLGEGASGALIEQIMSAADRDAASRAEKAKTLYDEWRQGAGLIVAERAGGLAGASAAWRPETGPEEEWVARRGRLADLVVLPRPASAGEASSNITFDAALFDTGRAVLAAPPDLKPNPTLTDNAAVIFWSGSEEAARAVFAALPLLALAPRVVIVASAENQAKAAEADKGTHALVEYLAWHSVRAEAAAPLIITTTAGQDLLSKAQSLNAGIVVMGAYTQSRLRQMVWGSVTRYVLGNAHLPVLLAH